MADLPNLYASYKTNYIVLVKDTVNNVLVKSFIANTTLSQLWRELEVYYGSLNLRSKKSGTLEDPILLTPRDFSVFIAGEIKDTGVIELYDDKSQASLKRSVALLIADFDSSSWSSDREQRTE